MTTALPASAGDLPSTLPRAFRALTLGLLIVWLILPLVPLAVWSVSKSWFFPDLLPSALSGRGWAHVVSARTGVLAALWESTLIATLTALAALALGLPAARALGMHRFRGKGMVEMLVLAPILVPGLAYALGMHGIFIQLGLTNSRAGVVIAHLIPTLPYVILVLASIFANLSPEVEAQARSLGARPAQVFAHVTLPMLRPGLIVAGSFAFLVSWSQYIPTLLIGGGRVETLPLVLLAFATSGRNDLTGAIGMIYILPGVLILALASRHLTGRAPGVQGGGVQGGGMAEALGGVRRP